MHRALPLRGMDAEAEPPWMGLRRGNALCIVAAPMVAGAPLARGRIRASFCLVRIGRLVSVRIRDNQGNRIAPCVFACCRPQLFDRPAQV
jgi:hypothetical protein